MMRPHNAHVRHARPSDVPGVVRVCSDGFRDTFAASYAPAYLEATIARYYGAARIEREVLQPSGWDGWLVAEEDDRVVGAGGGGLTSPTTWEVFVLYLDPRERRRGLGTTLLNAMTRQAIAHGAAEQWVDVAACNTLAMPFYCAHGFAVRGQASSSSPLNPEPLVSLRLARALPFSIRSPRDALHHRLMQPQPE